MFDALKRLIDPDHVESEDARVLLAWAKTEGHTFKHVKERFGAGHVVEAADGWRIEWGNSQRPYIIGKELRFRCDTGIPGDVQLIFLSKVLAQTFESDVFSRFTNAMQTQIDNTLPDEMRWLAMHPEVHLPGNMVVSRRFALFCNADAVSTHWLDADTVQALEEAATSWWSDSLVLVITLNRGILTARMAGQPLANAQLKLVSAMFVQLAARLKVVARLVA
ncbi:MAG: hypothetical protein KBA70_03155 [Aquabacterium sp.]|jgi:hypothetical protein|uniref:hypothetical protein n=1 Tax=Aquabacterium sp. TaxID=1872578 RepID=UPI001B449AD9|nr:hypothetical protein [Aquabacterium sp.]MBP7131739.1 hypothetical protein [Aquabacterium sp.]MBP9062758.1 hypothetical protein [Aquabacterium sp.]